MYRYHSIYRANDKDPDQIALMRPIFVFVFCIWLLQISYVWLTYFIMINLYMIALYKNNSGWPLFRKYFSRLQQKSLSNFDTWHHKTWFGRNLLSFDALICQIRKNTHKSKKIWFLFEKFLALENNSELPLTHNFSGPARTFLGTWSPWQLIITNDMY